MSLLRTQVGRVRGSPVFWVWLFAAALTQLPFLSAALFAPPGRVFAGTFFWIDDFYNYVSFVQQAEDGHLLFKNKLVLQEHAPSLLNLEWLGVGFLSRVLGRRPFLAYRILGLAASVFLLLATDRWLKRAGLPEGHRLPALALVSLGGGLGGIAFALAGRPFQQTVDLASGIFPFVEMLANPHWVLATSLLLWSLFYFTRAEGWKDVVRGLLLGTAVGLVRPYDLVLLAAVRCLAVSLTEPPRAWFRTLAPLAGLLPVCGYNYIVFYRTPAFGFYSRAAYVPPALADLALALAPAIVLALLSIRLEAADLDARRARAHLGVWAAVGSAIVLTQPVYFAFQFSTGLAVPLLGMGALGLSLLHPKFTWAATAALSTTAATAFGLVLSTDTYWYVPAVRMEAALALRPSCRSGGLVLAPPDIGLFTIGLTGCQAYASHRIMPDAPRREAEVRGFYEPQDHGRRASLLEREGVTHLVLPGDPGQVPVSWLGETTPFRQIALVGPPIARWSLYERKR